jgi:glycosyltransferase involved in cell wall biosynthesis
MAVMPIDGKNCNCSYLNGLALAVWWTEWAAKEARENGYGGQSTVIPLGVDLNIYKPMPKGDARKAIGLPLPDEAFVVGYIARNQPRKRLDLAVRHFGEWIKSKQVLDAYLYIQTAPTGETAYDVSELIRYERVSNRFIPVESDLRGAITEAKMAAVYNAIDVFWSTSQGEGFGMPALEAMACGTPCILPDWAAYGDWALPAARLVKIADTAATINFAKPLSGVKIAVLGATPDRADNVAALDQMYRDRDYRSLMQAKSLDLAGEDRFRWETIGRQFIEAATSVLDGPMVMTGR